MARVRTVAFGAPPGAPVAPPPQQPMVRGPTRQQMELAQVLQQAGTSMAPVQSPLEGVTRLGQAALGAYQGNLVEQQRAAREAAGAEDMGAIMAALGGDVPPTQALSGLELRTPEAREFVAQALMQQALAPGKEKYETIYDDQGRPIGQRSLSSNKVVPDPRAPAVPQPPMSQELLDQRMKLTAAGKPTGTSVYVAAGETATEEAIGKGQGQFYNEAQQQAARASNVLGNVNRARQLLRRVPSGMLTPAAIAGKRLAKALGVDLAALGLSDDVGPAEAMESLVGEFVNAQIEQTKGAITDKEMEIFARRSPGLTRTREGNMLILDTMEQVARRDREVAKLLRRYRASDKDSQGQPKRKGSLDGYEEALAQWQDANPLFTEETLTRMEALEQQGLSGGAPAGGAGGEWTIERAQ